MRSTEAAEAEAISETQVSVPEHMVRKAQSKQERETNVAVGKRIAALRKQQGLTQGQLAQKLELSQAVISSYEIGRTRPHPEVLLKLADILGASSDEMLGREKPKITDGGGLDRRLRRRLKLAMDLPRRDQDALVQVIDVFLALRLKEPSATRRGASSAPQ